MQQFPSQLLEKAVGEFAKLPGVGRKTALRFVLHLLRESKEEVDVFTETISTMRHDIKYCHVSECKTSDWQTLKFLEWSNEHRQSQRKPRSPGLHARPEDIRIPDRRHLAAVTWLLSPGIPW